MTEPPQLASLDEDEQQLSYKLPLGDRASHSIFKALGTCTCARDGPEFLGCPGPRRVIDSSGYILTR